MQPAPISIDLWHGRLRVRPWPATLPPVPGLDVGTDATAVARAGLRARVRRALQHAALPFVDTLADACPRLADDELPAAPLPAPEALVAWRQHGGHGLAVGLREAQRLDLALAATHDVRCRALVVTRDSGASHTWLRGLRERCGPGTFSIATLADALAWHGGRAGPHDLLIVDAVDQLPRERAQTLFADSPTAHRLGFATSAQHGELATWTAICGPLLVVRTRAIDHEHEALHVPLTQDERNAHDEAWHTFLCAYDRFASAQPQAGFGTFVQRARQEPTWRPALHAWHRAQRIAAWNVHKRAAVDRLLDRHAGARVLVFTPDRAAAYEIARAHLIAPITAELPRRERERLLDDFRAGRLRALVGPRLLDLGVHEGGADVAILVGGGFGQGQRDVRARRVRRGGLLVELVSEDTAEVGRAHRQERIPVGSDVAVHAGGRRTAADVAFGA